MSFTVETLENNTAKFTITVDAAKFEDAIKKAYEKKKGEFSVPGFRKGKVPQNMVEKMYGAGVFYEEAANICMPEAYDEAATESGLEIVSRPEVDVTQIEKGKDFIFTATVALKPEVELGEYKGVEVETSPVEVTDEDIEAEINKVREQNSRIVPVEDRAIEDGDIANINFEGFIDGVAFDGGKGEDYALTIGSHSFIDTFEEQLIGKNVGDKVDVNVTFPEQYQAAELAGKPATFKVEILSIKKKELPEVDEDFVQDISEFDTVDEYKEDVKKTITERKENAAKVEKENKIIEKIIEDSKMEIPDAMVDEQARMMVNEMAQNMQAQGFTIQQYMQMTGLTAETMAEQMKPQALKRIQSRLVLEAIAAAEKIEISDENVDEQLQKMAENYQMEFETLKGYMGENEIKQMKSDLAVQKAVDLIVEQAK
ncbi:trigger factor [Eubacterium uniforme]|uniref:Trigger factor n=1 Tax=Eubacterium uniforme TaxID=39495 RepID=A0A1T4VUE5_9FIRM|nr:trigger factor [Eubacterium uniforme]SKA68620.1 trigger factor [Eubacterium uniforme]HAH18469.1 trigger factor [Eubacterium sp.]HAV90610.1 trigger factor [Eubacterium sp.]HCJ38150.1 trigger factor [Erysipelotrichaceae bacterium]